MSNILDTQIDDCPTAVGELQLWNTAVTPDIQTSEVERHFVADATLPGVIVSFPNGEFGILSRKNLLSTISKPFGREVFIKRPVSELLKMIDVTPLVLAADTPIAAALKTAMSRRDDLSFEPLLVKYESFVGLLEVSELLTAQANLLEQTLRSKDALIAEIERTTHELRATLDEQERLAGQLSQAREIAQHEATHDALTGLPNRKLFLEVLAGAIAKQKADKAVDSGVLFIDLDRFKLVNDSLGHAAGNELLIEVATRLRQLVRRAAPATATAPARAADTVARLSGDEFAILLANKGRGGAEAAVAKRLLAALARPFTLGGVTVHISGSIGIVASIAGYDSTEAILRDADIAMYQAKSHGKACAVTFEPAMRDKVESRLYIENSLRDAISKEAFILHYQPIVDLRTDRISGAEALLRWQTEEGLVYPGAFIDIAEETGLIVPIGHWVFRRMCETSAGLIGATPHAPTVTMSINLSPLQFGHVDLCETLSDLVANAGINPRAITIEITERSAMADPDKALATLKQLKAIGFNLAIDDFGTGYSSLSYLHRFPIDVLKIDRSFIANLDTSEDGLKIVAAILALARSLDIEVVAEGVETKSQLDVLRELGCHFAQGYYFAKALTQAELAAKLQGQLIVAG